MRAPLAVLAVPLVLALPALGSGLAPVLAFAALGVADILAVATLKARARPGAVPNAVSALLAAICLVVNASKGLSAVQLSRDLDVQHKTAFVLMHKLREAMAGRSYPLAERVGTTAGRPWCRRMIITL